MNTRNSILAAFALIVLWIVLAFGLAIPSGWVHVPLGAGIVFIARAIVLGSDQTPDQPTA
jgi:hypothetical protein